MSQKRERNSRPAEETDSSESKERENRRKSAEKASASADEMLTEIDQALQEALGVGDKDLDDDELNNLADKWVKSYVQKGGQ